MLNLPHALTICSSLLIIGTFHHLRYVSNSVRSKRFSYLSERILHCEIPDKLQPSTVIIFISYCGISPSTLAKQNFCSTLIVSMFLRNICHSASANYGSVANKFVLFYPVICRIGHELDKQFTCTYNEVVIAWVSITNLPFAEYTDMLL